MTRATHFVDALEAVVAAFPEAVAIESDGVPVLTYAALWERAHGVAAQLAPGELVVLYGARSPELVVGMLAAWLAGAAWVPLLPELPRARAELVLAETGARVVLASRSTSIPPWLADLRFVELGAAPAGRASARRTLDDRAYVIYTSGSTGQPKGVIVTHRGLVPMLEAQLAAFELRPGARCLWVLSPGFDASVSDVGTALLAGATLCLEAPARSRSASGVLATIRERGITHVDLPPSLLPLLPAEQVPPSLRVIVVGGEVCAPAAIRAWASRVRVVNVYGPTEATVCTSLVACDPGWTRPLLGEPLPHVAYRVVDEELWIGGPAVAAGYLGRPALEAAKFVERDGERWFRTGDRVRGEGPTLELVGRLDRQAKVAGVLVAPEELEARLREHPRVRDAHVAVERIGTRDRLVAYYTADEELPDLRAYLAARVDPRLVPARFVRRALVAGKRGQAISSDHVLAAIWARVLGVEPGPDDDFFALGGDSLAVIECVGLAELAGVPLAPELLYTHRTLAGVVAASEAAPASSARGCGELIADVLPLHATCRAIRRAELQRDDPTDELLLTGATGFLGGRVLAELLARTRARITCLVRDPAQLPPHPRVRAVRGDLAAPQLGLAPAAYAELARVATIVHGAAELGLARPYPALRASNVVGTSHVLELAALGGARVHHVSSLAVFVGSDRAPGVLRETDALESAARLHGGYAQSKWAAEWLAREAGATVYRLGLLVATTPGGPARAWLTWLLRGLAQIDAVPEGLAELAVDLTPVEHAARVIAALVVDDARGTFHVANRQPATLGALVAALRRTGRAVPELPREVWLARVAAAEALVPEACAAVLGLCRGADYARLRTCDMFQATGYAFDTARVDTLAPAPIPDAALLDRLVTVALERG